MRPWLRPLAALVGAALLLAVCFSQPLQPPTAPQSALAAPPAAATLEPALYLPLIQVRPPRYRADLVPSPNPSTFWNYLSDVVTLSADNAWAVGSQASPYTPTFYHWDGATWTYTHFTIPESSPYGSGSVSSLHAVSADDIWAVGTFNVDRAWLTMHWNGAAWSLVSTPQPENGYGNHLNGAAWSLVSTPQPENGYGNHLNGVGGSATDDAWAVGIETIFPDGYGRTVTLHWDGTAWSHVPSPNPGTEGSSYLLDVTSTSVTDAWAVGYSESVSGNRTEMKMILIHWDGAQWTMVSDPLLGGGLLTSVVAVSPGDVWAAGMVGQFPHGRGVVYHWDGARWQDMQPPASEGVGGLTARSSQDVWAAADDHIIHWDGSAWSVIPVRGAPSLLFGLSDTAVDTEGRGWAVGTSREEEGSTVYNWTVIARISPDSD